MILGHSLPRGKTFFQLLGLPATAVAHATRFLLACLLCGARLSAATAASASRVHSCHRGNVGRFLRRLPAQLRDDWLEAVFGHLLAEEPRDGTWIFILDQTYCGHNSARLQNAYTTSPRGSRPRSGRDKRQKRKKQPQRYCHCFVFGLLLTPRGVRLPLWRPYLTKDYCAHTGRPYVKQTELGAAMIRELRVPPDADVVVLGDTAFDAGVILDACRARRFHYVVSMNGDRVLKGTEQAPKVTSLATGWAAQDYTLVRLTPGTGRYETHRRAAACRVGLRRKSRTFWVHQEIREVQNVGTARVLYSTMQAPVAGRPVVVQKVLLSNDLDRGMAALVELYDLRWQIELLFKELKSTLGLDRYRYADFRCVAGWVSLCVLGFVYLEWYRVEQLRTAGRTAAEQQRWRWQRSHGLSVAVRQEVEAEDLRVLAEWLQEPEGLSRVQQLLRRTVQKEYRPAA